MAECTRERNKAGCGCTYAPCAKKGVCCECLRSHWGAGELPGCLFPPDVEKTFDRSVERFVKTCRERGPWWRDHG